MMFVVLLGHEGLAMVSDANTFLEQPETDEIELTEVLHALSDPMRLRLVRELYDDGGERSCGSFHLPIAKSTLTHHWRVLRDAGVVTAREEGTRKLHSLRRDDLDRRFPGLLASIVGAEILSEAGAGRQ
jgi:DNA-binding transcriptional ArsR family regulator